MRRSRCGITWAVLVGYASYVWICPELMAQIVSPTTRYAAAASTQASSRAVSVRVVPWVEVCARDLQTLNHVVQGLLLWQKIADTAIVSVQPGYSSIFSELSRRVPNMHFIPGLQTWIIFGENGFDSVNGWKQVAKEMRALSDQTDSLTILLENETALKTYRNGKYTPNWDRFREGLRQIPSQYSIIWYPCSWPTDEIMQRYVRLARIVQENCDVQFVDSTTLASPADVDALASLMVTQAFDRFVKKPTVPHILCVNEHWWPFERIPEAVNASRSRWVIVYPGFKRWVVAAEIISKLMKPATASQAVP